MHRALWRLLRDDALRLRIGLRNRATILVRQIRMAIRLDRHQRDSNNPDFLLLVIPTPQPEEQRDAQRTEKREKKDKKNDKKGNAADGKK